MLYRKSLTPQLDIKLFKNPTSEYRAAPFWAWNCKLDPNQLLEQISQFKEMGMGGFHIHCRVGLDTDYLGDEYLSIVKGCVDKAKDESMLCWLYDEDRWPSGTAGGFVTENLDYRLRFLVFEPANYSKVNSNETYMAAAQAVRSNDRKLLGTYQVDLDSNGRLLKYKQVDNSTTVENNMWKAYLEV